MAVVNVTIEQVYDDVLLTVGGELDVSGLTPTAVGGASAGMTPMDGNFASVTGSLLAYTGVSGPTSFGPGGNTGPDVFDGDLVGIVGGIGLIVSTDFVNNSMVMATATWENTTIAELGVTPGIYEYTWPGDSLTLTVVPEPGHYAAILGMLGALALLRRRR